MSDQHLHKAEHLASLPTEWPIDLRPAIQKQLAARPHKVVVLDDDPTGTQTVHDIPVLTEWSVAALEAERYRRSHSHRQRPVLNRKFLRKERASEGSNAHRCDSLRVLLAILDQQRQEKNGTLIVFELVH